MRIGALLTLVLATLLLAACPRAYPEGNAPLQATGSGPWDGPTYTRLEQDIVAEARKVRQPEQPEVEQVTLRGPVLPSVDTLDAEAIPGNYLIGVTVVGEKLGVHPPSNQSMLLFDANGGFRFTEMNNWEQQRREGTWRKLRPGVLGVQIGSGQPITELHGQLLNDQFLYLWNYPDGRGMWTARIPEQASERIEHNRFQTNRGELVLENVVSSSFSGSVRGERPMTVSGFYNRGILSLRWEQDDRTATGYAMFVVGPEWRTINGYWWVDDYEAAPFGGAWTGTSIGTPAT